MPSNLSKDKKFVPIGKATQILGVSIDTVRRWDKAGILHSVRHDGKNRYFPVDELRKVKSSKPLSISDAARNLGISTTTLRRLDKRGILQPQRNQHGVRFYTHEDINNHINSDHFVPKKIISERPIKTSLLSTKESIGQLPQALITDRKNLANAVKETKEQVSEAEEEIQETEEQIAETQKQVTHLQHLHNIFNSSSAAVLATMAVVIVGISLSFLLLPEDTANFFGYERKPVQALSNQVLGARYPIDQETDQGNLVGRILKPIGRISLEIVRAVDEDVYEQIVPKKPIADVNDILTIDKDGNITPYYNFTVADTSYLVIPDTGLIDNLNADYLRGKVPGDGPGDLVYLDDDGNLSVSGTVEVTNKTTINSVSGDTATFKTIKVSNIDLPADSVLSLHIVDGEVKTEDIADNSVTASKLAPGISMGGGSGNINRVRAGAGLTGGGTASTVTLNVGAGDGINVNANNVEVSLDTTAANGTTTSSVSGLEFAGGDVSLIRGCANDELLKWNNVAFEWYCAVDTGAAGASLQGAYNAGNTITTSSARDIDITLADTATDSNFDIDIAAGSTSTVSISRLDGADVGLPTQLLLLENLDITVTQSNGLLINSAAGGITDAIDVSDPDITYAINIGANSILSNGTDISSTELNLLDGHDAALVDTNDAVDTAITGTGALNSGSITAGFGAINVGADTITTTGQVSAGTLNVSGTATFTGNITADDVGADNILIGSAADTVTITSDTLSLTDDNWSISAAGVASGLSGTNTGFTAGDLSCTNCIGATEVDESTIASTSLSDGANIAHINAAETISGGWTFNTAATTFTTAIDVNTASTIAGLTIDGAGTFTANNAATFNGDIDADDGDADNILLGQNGATPDTVTIAGIVSASGDVSITDSQWSVTAAGAATFASVASPTYTGAGAVSVSSGGVGALSLDSASGAVTFATDDDLIPTLGAGDADIGASGTRWDNVYATNGNFTNLTVGGTSDPYVNEAGDTMIGTLTFSGVATDITTVAGEDLVLIGAGAGIVDIQDTLNANSITSDAGVSIADANAYTGAGAVTLSSAAASALTIDSGTTGAIDIGTGANAKTITLGNATTTTTVNINSGTGGINLEAAGTGTTDVIQIGAGGAGSATPDYFALDVKSDTGDPAGGAEGYMYYNTFDDVFRCYQDTGWTNCIGAGSGFSGEVDDTTNDALTFTSDDASPPAGTVNSIFRDNTGDLNINTITGKSLNVQIAGADEYNFSASGLEFNSNNITGIGNITGSAGVTLASASNGNITVSPNGTGDTIINVDGDTNLQITAGAAPAVDMVAISNSGQGVVDTGIDGLSIDFTQADDADATDTNAGLQIDITSSSGDAGDILYGINIANITGGTASETALRIGTGWDTGISIESGGMTISGGSFTYASTNRQDRKVVLHAEYPGASLFGDGSSNTGNMTSDYTNSTTGDRHTYYEWDSGEAGLQDYTIVVRFTLPDNFGVWDATSAIVFDFVTETTTVGNNQIDISVFLETGAAADATDNDNVSGVAATWTDTTIDDADLGECNAAGETCVIEIYMQSLSNNYVRIGDITLNYDANF